jgi:hypothetical protein
MTPAGMPDQPARLDDEGHPLPHWRRRRRPQGFPGLQCRGDADRRH